MHREHKDFGSRNRVPDLTHCLDAIEFGHADVDQGYIGFQVYGLFHRLLAIRRLADDSPTAPGVEDTARTAPH